jgi:hypothetical protein
MAKKTVQIVESAWNTIHIFGYGETQINSEKGTKVKTDTLSKVQPLIDHIYSKKPEDNNSGLQFHVIHIFKDNSVRYISSIEEEVGFNVDYSEIDLKLVDDLVNELDSLPTE